MPWLRCIFLLAALATTSGFKFRCFMFCNDLTSIQQDYNEVRDECREYAQLRAESGVDGSASERHLVVAFSECMGKKGWDVPSGTDPLPARNLSTMPGFPPVGTAPAAPDVQRYNAPTSQAGQSAPAQPESPQQQETYLKRASECSFARHSASVSSNAQARAKACDIECVQRLRANPGGTRPAACPPDHTPSITPNMRKR